MFHAGSAIVDQVKVELVLPAEVVTVGHILERLQGSVLVSQAHFGQDVYVRFFLYPDTKSEMSSFDEVTLLWLI